MRPSDATHNHTIGEEERLRFYLGKLAEVQGVLPSIEISAEHKLGRPCHYSKHDRHEDVIPNYRTDLLRLLAHTKRDRLCFLCGDTIYTGETYPVLVKTRDSHDDQSNGVICSLQSKRHWNLTFSDIPWKKKTSDYFWRGADTGKYSDNNQRLSFVESYFSDRVGFSKYEQNFSRSPDRYLQKYLLGSVPRREIMQYKYQVVLEGNDKASNLNWVLHSNSVPIMSRPKYHSWLCESYLKPGVHYVEVDEDFSDFDDEITWCQENDDLAKEIAMNGKRFMSQFLSVEREALIEQKLIESVDQIYAESQSRL